MSDDHTYPPEAIMHIRLNNGEMAPYSSGFSKVIYNSSRICKQGVIRALVGVRVSKSGRTGEVFAD